MSNEAHTVIGPAKTRAARVLWMLEELGLPYTHHNAPPRSQEVMALNPSGKVPVLIVGDTAITDSTAINQYLADKHGKLTHKAGTLERARQDSLTQFLLDEFDSVLWVAARHSFILPEELRHSAIKDSLKWEFERSQKVLVQRMGRAPFATGEDFLVTNILLGHCLVWATSANFPVTEPRLIDYLEQTTARPGFQRAMAK